MSSRQVRAAVRDHALAVYAVLAVMLSWAWWLPQALRGGGGSHLPGLLGPAVAAVVVTGAAGGRPAVWRLLRRCGRWRVAPRWYAIAAAPMIAGVVGVVARAALGGGWPARGAWTDLPGLRGGGWPVLLLVLLVVNGFGEEIGWRGLAWPLLRRRHGFVAAAALLTVVWAFWHLPLFWVEAGLGDLGGPAVVPGWLVGLAAGTVVLGWLVEQTGGSLLLAATFHMSLNLASATVAMAGLPAAMASVAVIVLAVGVLRTGADAPAPPSGHPVRTRAGQL
jgi:membrane protease YdiL (CAAX protease family)